MLSTPIPVKVKSGEFMEGGLLIETPLEALRVSWKDVLFLYLGRVESRKTPPQKSAGPKINVVKAASWLVAGPVGTAIYDLAAGKGKPQAFKGESDSFVALDLYARDRDGALRFDSAGTNFRKFLGSEAGYSGEANLFGFLKKIVPSLENCVDEGVTRFLERGKSFLRVHPSRDDFAWASYKAFKARASNAK